MPQLPTKKLSQAVRSGLEVHAELEAVEKRHHLQPTAAPELGLAVPMYHWASGASLRAALAESPLAAGDFVRWTKQCIDVLDQLAAVPTASAKFANRCREAVDLIARGVVSYSTVTYQPIEEDFDDDDFDGL